MVLTSAKKSFFQFFLFSGQVSSESDLFGRKSLVDFTTDMAGLCFYLSFSILAACLFVIFQCTGKMFFVFLDSLCGIFAGFIERNLVKNAAVFRLLS